MTVIETERLILRALRRSDLAVLASVLNNFNISKNTAAIPFPYSLSDAEEFFAIAQRVEPRTLRLSITRKGGADEIFGSIEYEQDEDDDRAELGYWLAEPEWGKGLASEAARAMVAHAFEVSRHSKLVACFHNGNVASGRVLAGLGFEPIGAAMNFSKAQARDVPVTNLVLTREKWKGRFR